MNKKTYFKTIGTFLVSAFFLWMALRHFDADQFIGAVRHMNPLYFIPALLAYSSSFFFRTLRWQVMLRTIKPVSKRNLFTYIAIGFMANNLLPARLGEVVRAYVTGKREKISRSTAFASVILERLFDGLTILIILLLLMFIVGLDKDWLNTIALASSVLFVGGLLFLFGLTYQRDRVMAITKIALKILPTRLSSVILHILNRFVEGLTLLRTPKDFVLSILMSFPVWGCEVMVYFFYLKAFSIDVPFEAPLLALVVVNLSTLIPSSPGFVGVFEYACATSLAVFGVSQSVALAWSVAIHATQIIPMTILGLVILSRMGLSMKDIRQVDLSE